MKIKKKTTTKKPVNNLKGKIKIFSPLAVSRKKIHLTTTLDYIKIFYLKLHTGRFAKGQLDKCTEDFAATKICRSEGTQ